MEYMLTFHILNVYVDKTQPCQLKFTFNVAYNMRYHFIVTLGGEGRGGEGRGGEGREGGREGDREGGMTVIHILIGMLKYWRMQSNGTTIFK